MKMIRVSICFSSAKGRQSVLSVCLVLTVLVAVTSAAPAAAANLPPGVTHAATLAPAPVTLVEAERSIDDLVAEDEARERSTRGAPIRFALPLTTALSPSSDGTWTTMADGSHLWRLHVSAPDALSLNLWFSRFDLPAGAALWVHDAHGAQVHGPYSSADAVAAGELFTPVVIGSEVVVEALVPAGLREQAVLEVARVNFGYRFFGNQQSAAKQGSCNNDTICPEGDPWRDQIRSVARYTVDGLYTCTGTLVNNTAQDSRPFFLTADHCGITAANDYSMVIYWNYEAPTCGLLDGGPLGQNQTGATFRAAWNWDDGSDFALVELDDMPNESFWVYYSGWDRSGSTPSGAVGIHHPQGEVKAISFENDSLETNWGTHWVVSQWDDGTTESGSSGSCIFDPDNGLCMGTLSGGYASCENPTGDDWYGMVHRSWTGAGSSDSRLSDWLDPTGSGALTLAGMDSTGSGPSDASIWIVPAAAAIGGYGGAIWKSQLHIVNHTAFSSTANVYFVESGNPWPGTKIGTTHTISAGDALFLDDPLLPYYPTSGLLYVGLDQAGPIVSSRTFSLDDSGKTYGQGIPGILLDTATAPTTLILPLVTSIQGEFHPNLGLVQTSSGSYTVEVSIYSASGTMLAQENYTQTAAFRQINRLFIDMGISSRTETGAWVKVRLLSGSPSFWTAYISLVDDRSFDPTYIAGVVGG